MDALQRPLVVLLTIAGALVLAAQPWVRHNVPPHALGVFARLQTAILVLAIAYTVVRIVRALVRRPGTRFARVRSVGTLVARLVAVLVYVVAGLMVLDQYGISVTPILTSLGIAGLAVALALQDTLANFFAGLWIQTGRAMRPGHYVRIEDVKLEGEVVDVGWRSTLIRSVQNNLVVVPNAKLAQSVVVDHNLPDPSVSSTLTFTTAFDADPAAVERILLQEVAGARKDHPALLETPPIVRLNGFGDWGLQFLLIFFVRTHGEQFGLQDVLRRRILERFRREGIRIPYPTREVVVAADGAGRGVAEAARAGG